VFAEGLTTHRLVSLVFLWTVLQEPCKIRLMCNMLYSILSHHLREFIPENQARQKSITDGTVSIAFPVNVAEATLINKLTSSGVAL
jgi:hypothetical protein